MFHSTSHQMMRELDTGSAYRVQFTTSANHHTLSDLDELVQNHEQEQKAHDAVVQQAAERQNQLNAQLQMLYDTRTITRVTGLGLNMVELKEQHDAEQLEQDEKIKKHALRKTQLDEYGHQLTIAIESESQHKDAQAKHAEAAKIAEEHKVYSNSKEAEHQKNMDMLRSLQVPKKAAKPAWELSVVPKNRNISPVARHSAMDAPVNRRQVR